MFCGCPYSKRTSCRDFVHVDKQPQKLRAWQEVLFIALHRQKLIVYPNKRLWLYCRHNNVFDMTSPLRIILSFLPIFSVIRGVLWGLLFYSYFVLSLSAPNFVVPLNTVRPLCGMSCVWGVYFLRDHLQPRLQLFVARLSALTHLLRCACMRVTIMIINQSKISL